MGNSLIKYSSTMINGFTKTPSFPSHQSCISLSILLYMPYKDYQIWQWHRAYNRIINELKWFTLIKRITTDWPQMRWVTWNGRYVRLAIFLFVLNISYNFENFMLYNRFLCTDVTRKKEKCLFLQEIIRSYSSVHTTTNIFTSKENKYKRILSSLKINQYNFKMNKMFRSLLHKTPKNLNLRCEKKNVRFRLYDMREF